MNDRTWDAILAVTLPCAALIASVLHLGWVGYLPTLALAASWVVVLWCQDTAAERATYPTGVTYAGFRLPDVDPDEVFVGPDDPRADPWLSPPTEVSPMPVEESAMRAAATVDFADLLDRWDADLAETRRRWDREAALV